TGSRTLRRRQRGSTGRVRTPHFREASSAYLSPQPCSRERSIVLPRAGPSRPIPILSTGTRPNAAAISPLSRSQTFSSRKCVPRFEHYGSSNGRPTRRSAAPRLRDAHAGRAGQHADAPARRRVAVATVSLRRELRLSARLGAPRLVAAGQVYPAWRVELALIRGRGAGRVRAPRSPGLRRTADRSQRI